MIGGECLFMKSILSSLHSDLKCPGYYSYGFRLVRQWSNSYELQRAPLLRDGGAGLAEGRFGKLPALHKQSADMKSTGEKICCFESRR
jgi:hypothetical protein